MPIFDFIARITISLLPVVLFLVTLTILDSYKLVPARSLVQAIFVGCVAALASVIVNTLAIRELGIDSRLFTRYGAPVIEETLKAAFVIWLISTRRVGFMVDAAIAGFAVGTGFAIVENTYYIGTLETDNILVWIIRGFGTAVMHGGVTAIVAIVSKNLFDRGGAGAGAFLPGLFIAMAFHSFYNHFILSPVLSTVILYLTLPLAILFVFYRSERSTQRWLGDRLDVDAELLEMINTGRITETRIGRYFQSIRDRFPPEMVFDMVCYLRVHVELAITAKGVLMMREA
ncbi:MAG: PrsW family intramembrane metalloprotease, partial [Candidatus Krumholzibacteriota bacterium]|nr:PrsW family intramembrane metalloprotease [Candidatus Krumholzibacteriota bacterium]